jgi:hypothetical protein
MYHYATNGRRTNTFSTLTDPGVELASQTWTDGAGRVTHARTEHPDSTGGWSAVKTEYDILGRVISQSVPTEVTPGSLMYPETWVPTGDDAGAWKVNSMQYDWKGRVTPATNTDGTFKTITYEGCGLRRRRNRHNRR